MNENYPHIYVGPTIARLGIRRSMLVLGSIPPPPLKDLIELKPIVQALFVPTTRCREARINVETAGTIEHRATQEVIKFHQEKIAKEKKVSSERQRVPFFKKS